MPEQATSRIQSVDYLRGLVMVLMAIDHVRVYSGLPAGGPEAGIFLTRWVTHFCAPVFVFLTGTSAFLYGRRLNSAIELRKYLFKRGMLLIILEFTLIRFSWTFNFNYREFFLMGVIWMLGACMVLLSLMVTLKPRTIGIIGLILILFQNVFALVPQLVPESLRAAFGSVWEFIYSSGFDAPQGITILYVLVPWIGVMAAGYWQGELLLLDPARPDCHAPTRNAYASLAKRLLISIGTAAILLYLAIGTVLVLQMPEEDRNLPFVFQLLNQRKYPASQLFLLMTLGPSILLMAFVEDVRNGFSRIMTMFGRVPMFYYLMHIPLIHVSAIVVNLLREGRTFSEWYANAPYVWFQEDGHQWPLGLLYIVFVIDVVILYFLCRWYERYKFAHPEAKWTKYV